MNLVFANLSFNGPKSAFLTDPTLVNYVTLTNGQLTWKGADIVTPSYSSSKERTPRIDQARFGDGYEQRMESGLNARNDTLKLVWTQRRRVVIQAIDNFLKGHSAQYPRRTSDWFYWIDPDDLTENPDMAIYYQNRYVCESWNISKVQWNSDTLTATFRRVFDAN